jgi:hypothetical protein
MLSTKVSPIRKIRTRLVNFRVTDEEFERLKASSDRQGARCLSDFARSIMFGGTYDDRLLTMDHRLTGVEQSMARLVEALSGSRPQDTNTHD